MYKINAAADVDATAVVADAVVEAVSVANAAAFAATDVAMCFAEALQHGRSSILFVL